MRKINIPKLYYSAFTDCFGCSDSALPDQEIQQIAYEAYEYALPLVIMDLTFKNLTNVTEQNGAPSNQFNHVKKAASADDKSVVRLNVDTLYSTACLNLSDEPLVFSKPKTDRYCSIAIYDAYTNCSAILGTGGMDNGEAAVYMLSGPDYKGSAPEGVIKLSIPTNMAWMLVRTECADKNDLPNAHNIQNKLILVPLSEWGKPNYVPPKGSYDPGNDFVPFEKIQEMDIETFFHTFNRLAVSNPGTDDDKPALERYARIGIGPGLDFHLNKFPAQTQQVLQNYPGLVMKNLIGLSKEENSQLFYDVNHWLYSADNIARFGMDYKFRAVISLVGLGANPVDMAIYPSADCDSNLKPLDGNNSYVIHFEENQIPPCMGFWSITAYDQDGFLVDNPINKYAIRNKDNLLKNPDGSVDIYLQSESPGEELQHNWLPVPKAAFQLTLRIYLPEESVLDLSWKPPYVVRTPSSMNIE